MNTTERLPEVTPTQSDQGTTGFAMPSYSDPGFAAHDPYTTPAAAPAAGPSHQSSPETIRIFAIVSFVLGIASIVSGWTFIAPIAGLVFGIIALRRRTTERTLALWGVWLNGIMLAFTAIGMLIGVTILGAGLLAIPFSGF